MSDNPFSNIPGFNEANAAVGAAADALAIAITNEATARAAWIAASATLTAATQANADAQDALVAILLNAAPSPP